MKTHQEPAFHPSSSPSIYFDFNNSSFSSSSTLAISTNCCAVPELMMPASAVAAPPLLTSTTSCDRSMAADIVLPAQPHHNQQQTPANEATFPSFPFPNPPNDILLEQQQPSLSIDLYGEKASEAFNPRYNNPLLDPNPQFTGFFSINNGSISETTQFVSQLFNREALFGHHPNTSFDLKNALLTEFNHENGAGFHFGSEMGEKAEAQYAETPQTLFPQTIDPNGLNTDFLLGGHISSPLPSTSYSNDASTYLPRDVPCIQMLGDSTHSKYLKTTTNPPPKTTSGTDQTPKKYARKRPKASAKTPPAKVLQKQRTALVLDLPSNDAADSVFVLQNHEVVDKRIDPCHNEINKDVGDTDKNDEDQLCFICQKSISDRFLLSVNNSVCHPDCLKCFVCQRELEESPTCFIKCNIIYCKACYSQKFQSKCISCDRQIQATDWVRRARNFLYHLACFSCDHCKRQLSTGEQFSIQENRLLCKQHYMELVQGDDSHTKQKTKRVRTTFAEEQIGVLQAHFQIDCNPDGSDLERIEDIFRARQKKYQVTKKNGGSRSASGISAGDSFTASMNSGRSSSASIESHEEGENGMTFPTSVTTSADDLPSTMDRSASTPLNEPENTPTKNTNE